MPQHPSAIQGAFQRIGQGFRDTGSQLAAIPRFIDEQIFQHPVRAAADIVGMDVGTAIVLDAPAFVREGHPFLAAAVIGASFLPIPGAQRSAKSFIKKFDEIHGNLLAGPSKAELKASTATVGMSQRAIRRAEIIQPEREVGKYLALVDEGISPTSLLEATNQDLKDLLDGIEDIGSITAVQGHLPQTVAGRAGRTRALNREINDLTRGARSPGSRFTTDRASAKIQQFGGNVELEVIDRIMAGDQAAANMFLGNLDTPLYMAPDLGFVGHGVVPLDNSQLMNELGGLREILRSEREALDLLLETIQVKHLP